MEFLWYFLEFRWYFDGILVVYPKKIILLYPKRAWKNPSTVGSRNLTGILMEISLNLHC